MPCSQHDVGASATPYAWKNAGAPTPARGGAVSPYSRQDGALCPHTWQDRGDRVPSTTRNPEPPAGWAGGCDLPAPSGCAWSWCHGCPHQPRVPVGAATRGGRCHSRRWHGQAGTATQGWHGRVGRAAAQGLWHEVAGAEPRLEPSRLAATGHRPLAHAKPRTHTTGWDWGLGALGGPGAAPPGWAPT